MRLQRGVSSQNYKEMHRRGQLLRILADPHGLQHAVHGWIRGHETYQENVLEYGCPKELAT